MSQLDEVIERIRRDADALYGFVLSRRGQTVTHAAPRDMPEGARSALVAAANLVAGTDRVVSVRLTHGELSPGAGEALVDGLVGVAAERAVVCLVIRGGTDPRRASAALSVGLRAIEPMLARALTAAAASPGGAMPQAAPKSGKRPRDSTPQIVVEPARQVGSETMQAIEQELARGGELHVPAPHIPRDVLRTTLPWKDMQAGAQAAALQATTSGKRKEKGLVDATPRLTVRLDEEELAMEEAPRSSPPSSRMRRKAPLKPPPSARVRGASKK